MAKRSTKTAAGKRKRDPIEVSQLQRERELVRMNARERKIRRMFKALERERRRTDIAARAFFDQLGADLGVYETVSQADASASK